MIAFLQHAYTKITQKILLTSLHVRQIFCIMGCFVCTALFGIFLTPQTFGYNDLMEQAFDQSQAYEQVVNIGDTKEAVGNSIFYDSKGVACTAENGIDCNVTTNQSLLVRGIKLFLRLVIILAVPFIIFNAVYLIVEVIGGGFQKVGGFVLNIVIGIIVVLSAVAIIQLVQSAVVSSTLGDLLGLF